MKKLTFAIILLSLFSCEEKLPKPTQDGNNTFGCQVNGKTWIPNGGTGFMSAKPINGGFLRISGQNKIGVFITTFNKSDEEIEIYLTDSAVKEYVLNEDTGYKPNQLYPKNYGLFRNNSLTYITSQKNTGIVTITKSDTISGTISGTFEFIVGSGTEKINITKGRFDVNHKTQ